MAQLDHHVLHRVGRGPFAVRCDELGMGVEVVDQRLDRRCVGRVGDERRRQPVEGDRRRHRNAHRLGVGGEVAAGATDERVLADVDRSQELLGGRSAHRSGHRRHDHVRQPEPVEQLDVGLAVELVRTLEAGVVDVERVRVLHHELAAAQETGSRACLVAVLGLDLVDVQRQILVRRVEALHEQREHLLVGRSQQEVVPVTILQAEQVVAVLGPAVGSLVRLAGQQRREVDLLEAGRIHLGAHDVLDVAVDDPPERQPREAPGCRAADVPGPHQQLVRGHLGVVGIVPQRAQEQRRHAEHPGKIPATAAILRRPYLVHSPKRRGLSPRLVL